MALQSVTLTLKLSLKMPYFPDYYEGSFTFVTFKTDVSIKWSYSQEFLFEVRFYFSAKKRH